VGPERSRRSTALVRLGVLGVLCVSWLALFALVDPFGDSGPATSGMSPGSFQDVWEVEDLFIRENENYRRREFSVPLAGRAPTTDPGRLRVLLAGDSFTFGSGLLDKSTRLGRLLEEEMVSRVGPVSLEVVDVSEQGHTFFTIHDAVSDVYAGRRQVDKDPRFDAVVVGAYVNDHMPIPQDAVVATEGIEVIEPWSQEAMDIIYGDAPNPYAPLVARAALDLVRQSSPAPVLWVPLGMPEAAREVQWEVLADSGMVRVGTGEQDRMLDDLPPSVWMANPVDPHLGPSVNAAVARDVVSSLLELLPDARLREAASITPPARALFADVSPAWLDVSLTAEGATRVVFDGSRPQWCVDQTVESNGLVQKAGDPSSQVPGGRSFVCDALSGQTYRTARGSLAALTSPCALLGRPHVVLSVDRLDVPGVLDLRLLEGDGLRVWLRTGELEGSPVNAEVGRLSANGSLRVPVGPGYGALLLARDGTCLDPGSFLTGFVLEVVSPKRAWVDPVTAP